MVRIMLLWALALSGQGLASGGEVLLPPVDRLAAGDSLRALILPIAIVKLTNLNFGQVAAGASSGTVVVAPAGARTAGGGASLGSGALVSAATFTVSGDPLATFSVSLSPSATLAAGSHVMTVDTFASSPSGSGQLGILGTKALSIGATLHVGALQSTGLYAGSFNVTVAYN